MNIGHRDSERVELLAEMFPEVPGDQLHQTLLTSSGDMDTAIQLLLDQPVGAGGGPAGCTGKPAEVGEISVCALFVHQILAGNQLHWVMIATYVSG